MNDLFKGLDGSAHDASPLSAMKAQEGDRPGSETVALSPEFRALAARFERISARNYMREPWVSPHRTVSVMNVLAPTFASAWERARVSEMIDVCPAEHMIDLVGSRDLAEKIADALRFPVKALLQ